ncbi:hypothetical protein DZK27_02940 [Rhodobacteraceae bacterium 63075]|nr:hypothetical protein DZK27_02940 [Rhodobacteraceae bacterium 63075]
MSDLFQSCERIYVQLAAFHSRELQREIKRQSIEPEPSGNADGREKVLMVTAVSYSSPGWADFLGAGELTGHLKDFILGIIDRIIERKDREQGRQLTSAQIEAAALDNYSKQLELLDQAFDFAERADLNDGQRQAMLNEILQSSRTLGKAVVDGRLNSVVEHSENQ